MQLLSTVAIHSDTFTSDGNQSGSNCFVERFNSDLEMRRWSVVSLFSYHSTTEDRFSEESCRLPTNRHWEAGLTAWGAGALPIAIYRQLPELHIPSWRQFKPSLSIFSSPIIFRSFTVVNYYRIWFFFLSWVSCNNIGRIDWFDYN